MLIYFLLSKESFICKYKPISRKILSNINGNNLTLSINLFYATVKFAPISEKGTVRAPADHRPLSADFKISQGSLGTFSKKLKVTGVRTIFF